MTREEATEVLKELWRYEKTGKYTDSQIREALDMAIKALEHPEKNVIAIMPCGDAISREDALMCATGEIPEGGTYEDALKTVAKRLQMLPPVMPEPNRCNQCKYYEGVHNVQGHAPCSFLKCGGVLWDWYCSNYEPYKEGK